MPEKHDMMHDGSELRNQFGNSDMGHNRSDEAVTLAVQGRWEEAVLVNQEILEISPNDVDALNRMGKALSEVGRISQSRQAYEQVLKIDSRNSIARKNLARLSHLKDEEPLSKETHGIDSRFYIEEASKARRVNMYKLASPEVLGKMAPGNLVHLRVNDKKLEVVNDPGEYLGEIAPKIGARIARLIEGGNEYKSVIVNLEYEEVKVIIRETFQHPSQSGYPSFPPPKVVEEIRPYLKDSMVKRELEEPPLETAEKDEEDTWAGVEDSLDSESTLPAEDEIAEPGKGGTDKVI
ncbi:MAG: hypothetical protein R6U37_03095 [Dehalococcoidia bacterium]